MQRTRIEWVRNPDGTQGYTWNPIKGICPVNCKLPDGRSYCYARKMYKRFGWEDTIFMQESELYEPAKLKKLSKIFVCSTIELFHPDVKINAGAIFNVIKENPQHTFQILTKFPQNIDRPMPDNVWLGVSITKPIEMYPRIKALYQAQAKLKFVSFEPLLGDVGQFRFQGWLGKHFDWIIIGRLTGHGHKNDPKDLWIQSLVYHAKKFNTPLFLKDNLKEIWGEKLIQEFPIEEGK